MPENDGAHNLSDGSHAQPVDGADLRISYGANVGRWYPSIATESWP
jgi:hypothetical protein